MLCVDGWMVGWMVIIGHWSFKSTFGAKCLDCGHGDDGQNECGWADNPSSSQQVTTMMMTSALSTISTGVLFCKIQIE